MNNFQLKEKVIGFCTFAAMKKLLLLILFVLNLVLLQAQQVKFISVNGSVDSLENLSYKPLSKQLSKTEKLPDTLTTPTKWMLKLNKKLSQEQSQDSNIYIFFCPSAKDSLKAYLPLSGKYGYVLFDSSKTGIVELAALQRRLCMLKYQWDLIHDPENMLGLLQGDEEGAEYSTNLPLTDTKWYTPANSSEVTFLTPSGQPFKAKNVKRLLATTGSISLNFTEKGSLNNDGTITLSADRGVVIAYEKEVNGEVELWTAVTMARISDKGENYYDFYGYKRDLYEDFEIDGTSPSESYFECFYVDKSGNPTTLILDYKKEFKEFLIGEQKTKYTGAGVFVGDIATFSAKINLPEDVYGMTDFSKVDTYGHTVWAKFNYFGDNGLLQKIYMDGEYLYLYTLVDSRGNKQYYQFDLYLNRWRDFTFDKATLEDIFDYDVMSQLYKDCAEAGHASLDILGFIPALGEAFDVINGFWYAAEGEFGQMVLCFGSCVPIVGDATFKGAKYLIKAVDIAAISRRVDLLGDAAKSFNKISGLIATTDKLLYAKCLDNIGNLLKEYEQYGNAIENLVATIKDAEKLQPILSKIDELGDAKVYFLYDIKQLDNLPSSALANNLDKLDEGIVEAYKSLQSTSIRADFNWLKRAAEWKQFELAYEQVGDVVQITSKEGDEIAQVIKEGNNLNFEIADDYFVEGSFTKSTNIDVPVKTGEGDLVLGGKIVEVDGKIGFVEDVSSYAASAQQTIKQRYKLRKALAETAQGISKGQEAHHIIPVNLLKNNDIVQKAVEGGFDFNGATNGLAIDKYVKKTGAGRHANHPSYDGKISEVFQTLENMGVNLSPSQSKKLLDNLIDGNSKYEGIKSIIKNATNKLDDLNLKLDQVDVLDLLGD